MENVLNLSQSQTCVRLRLAEKGDFGVFSVVFNFIFRVLFSFGRGQIQSVRSTLLRECSGGARGGRGYLI